MKSLRKHYTALTVLNALAIPITIFLIYLHFKPEVSTLCTFGEKWDCDIVNKSIYARFLGVPNAIWGLGAYSAFLVFSIRGFYRNQKKFIPYMLLAVAGATGFALYLTGVEFFVLKAFCLFCVLQQIIILIELGVMVHLWRITKK